MSHPPRADIRRFWTVVRTTGLLACAGIATASMVTVTRPAAAATAFSAPATGFEPRVIMATPIGTEPTSSGSPTRRHPRPRPTATSPGSPTTETGSGTPATAGHGSTAGTPSPNATTHAPSLAASPTRSPAVRTPAGGWRTDRSGPGGGATSGSSPQRDEPSDDGGAAQDAETTWTSYLPAPETGLKIFAAGLIGLAVAIGGLATLAIRRREH